MEWNGRSLTEKTYEEVYDIIAESKQEAQVELIVSRPIRRAPLAAPINPNQTQFSSTIRISRRHTDVNIPNYQMSKHGMMTIKFIGLND